MPIKLFRVAVCDSEAQEEEMNRFVRGHKVVEIKAHFVSDGAASFWSFCVDFLDGAPRAAQPSPPQSPKKPGGKPPSDRIDYRDILSPEDFLVYSQLRDLRAVLADKENVARFLVCTNAQLAAMVTSRATTQAALGKIQGFGSARVEKYGAALLEILTKAWMPANEASEKAA